MKYYNIFERKYTSLLVAVFDLLVRFRIGLLSLLLTFIYYYPSLNNNSVDAGILYRGDTIGFYSPSIIKIVSLLQNFQFAAIDMSLFNGSSDYFISPNFFTYHPLLFLYGIFSFDIPSYAEANRILLGLLFFHTFISLFFTQKLCHDILKLETLPSFLAAVLFTFSLTNHNALGQPPFFFIVTTLPAVLFASILVGRIGKFSSVILASFPVVVMLLGGYLPLAAGNLLLAVLVIAIFFLIVSSSKSRFIDFRRCIRSSYSIAFGFLVASPAILSIILFHNETTSPKRADIFFSAQQLSQQPVSILKSLFAYANVPTPIVEFNFWWGTFALVITIMFISQRNLSSTLSRAHWRLFYVSAGIYFLTALSTFGVFSIVSDFVYYFIPKVGEMHIYQRFMLSSQLFFGIMLALMLVSLLRNREKSIFWGALISVLALLLVLFTASYIIVFNNELSTQLGLNNYIVIELLLALFVSVAMMLPSHVFKYLVVIFVAMFVPFDKMYDESEEDRIYRQASQRQVLALSDNLQSSIVNFMKTNAPEKEIIKYVDLTPMWNPEGVESFPKVFPYFVLNKAKLSSYGGFTFYLSSRAEYIRKIPVGAEVAVQPNWDLLSNSGADFGIIRKSDILGKMDVYLASIMAVVDPKHIFDLPGDVILFKFPESFFSKSVLYDNGYFRLLVSNEFSDDSNLAFGKTAKQSSTSVYGAQLAVDGNVDGNYSAGSITHTESDVNAWWEVDLGSVQKIGAIQIWNRTDCCQDRLKNYQIFASKMPFAADDTATRLQNRSDVDSFNGAVARPVFNLTTDEVEARYIRVQLDGQGEASNAFLSLAELKVYPPIEASSAPEKLNVTNFETDGIGNSTIVVETSDEIDLKYLFHDNPRVHYYLNGDKIEDIGDDGYAQFNLPAGTHTLNVKYSSILPLLFGYFYLAYLFVIIALCVHFVSLRFFEKNLTIMIYQAIRRVAEKRFSI